MSGTGVSVRVATVGEVATIIDWAAAEGWNPGLVDASCFRAQDPDGFFVGVEDEVPVSAVSVVTYGEDFAFLGLYIVRPDRRGQGHGLATWRAGLAHAGRRTVGLDGVVAQQDNYRRSGFALAHRNIRYAGTIVPSVAGAVAGAGGTEVVALGAVDADRLLAYDGTCFPAPRPAFLRAWATAPGHRGFALIRDGQLAGYGVARPARDGYKIGPLFADDQAGAETLFDALTASLGSSLVCLDVPEPNAAAARLAERRGLVAAFETARMYTGPIRPVALDRVFGITSFELG